MRTKIQKDWILKSSRKNHGLYEFGKTIINK